MTREEFEGFVAEQMKLIAAKLKEYCPESPYLTMAIGTGDKPGCIFWNSYYDDNVKHPVDFREIWEEEDGKTDDAEG